MKSPVFNYFQSAKTAKPYGWILYQLYFKEEDTEAQLDERKLPKVPIVCKWQS